MTGVQTCALPISEQYAAQDGIKSEALETLARGQRLVARVQRALNSSGKQLDKAEKKQVKTDCNELSKLLSKITVDKVTQNDLATLNESISRLKHSSANVCHIAGEMDDETQI